MLISLKYLLTKEIAYLPYMPEGETGLIKVDIWFS